MTRTPDFKAIEQAEALSRLVKSPEWQIVASRLKELRDDWSDSLLNMGMTTVPHGYPEFYIHRLAALNIIEDWIDDEIEAGQRERTILVDAEATSNEALDGSALTGNRG
jgi:hypothetical protein